MMRLVSLPWMNVVTCVGELATFSLVMVRGSKSALRVPLSLLCLDVFLWSFGALAYRVSGHEAWHGLDDALSPLTMPLMLHVVLAFVGRARRARWFLAAMYAFFLGVGSATAYEFLTRGALPAWWSPVFLASELALIPAAMALLVMHRRETRDPLERTRTSLMLGAIAMSVLFGLTEFADVFGLAGVPPLAHVGALLSAVLIATVDLRFRLFGEGPKVGALLLALVAGGFMVLVYLAVFRFVPLGSALVSILALTLVLALVAPVRGVFGARAAHAERVRELSTLGRFSAQMAHDLKNPLASLKGAVQFLQEERAQGRSIDAQAEFLPLMLEQVSRLQRVIDRYQRISRVEPKLATTDVSEVVEGVLSMQAFVAPGVKVEANVAHAIEAVIDGDLLAVALENLLRNALEAMPGEGRVVVHARLEATNVIIAVEDDGPGIDPRDRERVLEDFFTTKAEGSGLGLPYVQRIVRAHGGDIEIATPKSGRGTMITMRLPKGPR